VTQIDHLLHAGDGILVIETKTYAGLIIGALDDRQRMQRLDNGECNRLPNPRRQNYGHLKSVIDDLAVPARGYVVSAGKALRWYRSRASRTSSGPVPPRAAMRSAWTQRGMCCARRQGTVSGSVTHTMRKLRVGGAGEFCGQHPE
jgi:hypothetical protein